MQNTQQTEGYEWLHHIREGIIIPRDAVVNRMSLAPFVAKGSHDTNVLQHSEGLR